ncbi:ribbon-helix-helix protein, CopG family [bacterium]|jgi:Arc/MetJ-type ribon-helix-helix transcriptional regulator|nr:ribbon-helix-helix protein, CopG family [bacterium]MBT4122109.1 ribbon-helix-helix protein, CopG family [bacterium]MBT4335387.1 ribbon-helix-helix protein, CopG family [bacterium]MBT4495506.1 ribbon-helix-helix protein, CopG family [bacterium]MBT4764318.1 ribbon-helix-helix protein, CopG family [bacterium]
MREVINLSLPSEMASTVKQAVKKGHYASTSEFFRDLLRSWMEDRIVLGIKKSQKQINKGQGKKLGSLKDLR